MSELPRDHADPWGDAVDVETLHQAVTDAIVEEVADVAAKAQREQTPPTQPARLVLGPAGIGKTHLFARLRRLVQQRNNRVSFVHVRPSLGSPLTTRMLLANVLGQLRKKVGDKSQLDLLVGSLLALYATRDHRWPNVALFDADPSERQHQRLLASTVDHLLERHPELEACATYVDALLQVPFFPLRKRLAWLEWLEGREVEERRAKEHELPPTLSDDQVLAALRALAVVAAPAAPLLLVFDQLENLADGAGDEPRILAYGHLVAELVDTVPGLVVVQMAVESDWAQRIDPHLSSAARSRLSADPTSRRRALLSYPTADERRLLVERWRATLVPSPTEPSPWPLSARRMDRLAREPGVTPRMLLLAFREALLGGNDEAPEAEPGVECMPPAPLTAVDLAIAAREAREAVEAALAAAWNAQAQAARERLVELEQQKLEADATWLLDGLLALGAVAGRRVERDPSETAVRDQASGRRALLVHSSNGTATAKQLKRLVENPTSAVALALRERWRPLPATWAKAHEYRAVLEQRGALRWSWLEREEVVGLLGLHSLWMSVRSHDVSGPDGKPIDEATARAWLSEPERLGLDRLRAWLEGVAPGGAEAESEDVAPPPAPSRPSAPPARANAPRPSTSPVWQAMRRLRVASVERVARELRGEPRGRQNEVRAAIAASGGALELVGSSIVVWVEPE